MKCLILLLLLCCGVARAEDTFAVSTDSFKHGRIVLKMPKEPPKFTGMILECKESGDCYWKCAKGLKYQDIIRGDNMMSEAIGCADDFSAIPKNGLLWGDAIYHAIPN